MPKFNHQLAIAFTVLSDHPEGEDITSDMMKAALRQRIADLDSSGELEWQEACLPPCDTDRIYAHSPDRCPSNHWNGGDDICEDCGANLNSMEDEDA